MGRGATRMIPVHDLNGVREIMFYETPNPGCTISHEDNFLSGIGMGGAAGCPDLFAEFAGVGEIAVITHLLGTDAWHSPGSCVRRLPCRDLTSYQQPTFNSRHLLHRHNDPVYRAVEPLRPLWISLAFIQMKRPHLPLRPAKFSCDLTPAKALRLLLHRCRTHIDR